MERLSKARFGRFFSRRHAGARASQMALRLAKLEPTEALVWDETSSRYYPGTLAKAAEELGKPVAEVTAVDLLDYPHENLPDGPPSELGGEIPGYLRSRPEAEMRRRAASVAARVDALIAQSEQQATQDVPRNQ